MIILILGDCSQFMSHIETNSENLTRSWTCHLCSKLYVSKNAMEDHIRGSHLGTLSAFECKFCGKQFQSRNSRSGHMSKHHKLEMGKQWPQWLKTVFFIINIQINYVYLAGQFSFSSLNRSIGILISKFFFSLQVVKKFGQNWKRMENLYYAEFVDWTNTKIFSPH